MCILLDKFKERQKCVKMRDEVWVHNATALVATCDKDSHFHTENDAWKR